MLTILVTFEVLKLLLKFIDVRLVKPKNISSQSGGANIGASLAIYKLYKS